MNKSAVIIGAGTYGQIYAEYLKTEYNIIGFIDNKIELIGEKIQGIPVLGDNDYLWNNISKNISIFIPIGNNEIRSKLLQDAYSQGFRTPNFIHPSANIDPSVKIADRGVYILQNTIIMPLTKINEGVMISSGSIISHHSTIDKYVFISFGVNVGASLRLKKYAYLGIGSTIMTGIKEIGEKALIGAGSVVIRDVPDGCTVVGNPGRIIRKK